MQSTVCSQSPTALHIVKRHWHVIQTLTLTLYEHPQTPLKIDELYIAKHGLCILRAASFHHPTLNSFDRNTRRSVGLRFSDWGRFCRLPVDGYILPRAGFESLCSCWECRFAPHVHGLSNSTSWVESLVYTCMELRCLVFSLLYFEVLSVLPYADWICSNRPLKNLMIRVKHEDPEALPSPKKQFLTMRNFGSINHRQCSRAQVVEAVSGLICELICPLDIKTVSMVYSSQGHQDSKKPPDSMNRLTQLTRIALLAINRSHKVECRMVAILYTYPFLPMQKSPCACNARLYVFVFRKALNPFFIPNPLKRHVRFMYSNSVCLDLVALRHSHVSINSGRKGREASTAKGRGLRPSRVAQNAARYATCRNRVGQV